MTKYVKQSGYKAEKFPFVSRSQKFHSMVTRACGLGAHGDIEHHGRQHEEEEATHLMAFWEAKEKEPEEG